MPNQKVLDRAIQLLDVKVSVVRGQKRPRISSIRALCDIAEQVIASYEYEKKNNGSA